MIKREIGAKQWFYKLLNVNEFNCEVLYIQDVYKNAKFNFEKWILNVKTGKECLYMLS